MGDRERLIELLEQHCLLRHDVLECSAGKEIAECSDCLANWLIENGVILPPCKVEDTVYAFSDTIGAVLEYFVESLNIAYLEENRNCYTYEANCNTGDNLLDSIDFDFDDIGETVFLAREEAERALKGGEG